MNDTQQILEAIQNVKKDLTTRLDTMQTDISGLKTGQKNLEEGQKRLKEGQKAMQADISTLKEDTSSLKEGQKNTNREVLHTKTATEAIIAGLTEIKKGDYPLITSKIDKIQEFILLRLII